MGRNTGWREIRGRSDAAFNAQAAGAQAAIPNVPDSYVARVIKLIPAEVVSVYVALSPIVEKAQLPTWSAFAVGLVGTPLYLRQLTGVTKFSQLATSTLAFVVWVAALGGPLEPTVSPLVGAFLLVVFTFFLPLLQGR